MSLHRSESVGLLFELLELTAFLSMNKFLIFCYPGFTYLPVCGTSAEMSGRAAGIFEGEQPENINAWSHFEASLV